MKTLKELLSFNKRRGLILFTGEKSGREKVILWSGTKFDKPLEEGGIEKLLEDLIEGSIQYFEEPEFYKITDLKGNVLLSKEV